MATKTLQKKKAAVPVLKANPALATRFKLTGTSQATDLADIVTVIKNTSGKTLVFGFIPPHGKELADGESITIKGDLRAQLNTGGGRVVQRKQTALQNALDDLLIEFHVDRRQIVYCAADSSTVIAVGDLLWLDTDDVKRASSFAWNSTLAQTQNDFANKFLGIALTAKASGAAATNVAVQIAATTIYTYSCTSETHEIGDTFGPAKNPSANELLNQKLEKAVAASSIARAVKRNASASTTAVVRFQSAYWGDNAAGQQ